VGVLVTLLLVIRHAARAALIGGIVTPLVLWLLGHRGTITWVSIAAGIVIVVRFTIDWNRQYRELWLDRER